MCDGSGRIDINTRSSLQYVTGTDRVRPHVVSVMAREVARRLAASIHESGGEQPDLLVVVLGVVGVPLHGEMVAVVSESHLFERLFKGLHSALILSIFRLLLGKEVVSKLFDGACMCLFGLDAVLQI